MPTVDQINTFFGAILPILHELTNENVPTMFGYRDRINDALDHNAHIRGKIVDGIRVGLTAIEVAPPKLGDAAPVEYEWAVVKHVKFPIWRDDVIARFPDADSAYRLRDDYKKLGQWWTTYTVDRRVKSS